VGSRLGALLGVCLALAGAVVAAPSASVAQARISAAALPFHWKFPSFAAGGHWSTRSGVLSYDGQSVGSLEAPITVTPGTNLTVQVDVQFTGAPGPTADVTGAGVFVRTRKGNLHDSIYGGSFISSASDASGPQLYWSGTTVGGLPFDVGTGWYTYQLQVRGLDYRLLIDGQLVVEQTIYDDSKPTRVGIFSTLQNVHFRNFAVSALPAGSPTPQPKLPLPSLVVGLADLPTEYFCLPYERHVATNAQVAASHNESLSTVETTGQLSEYAVEYYVANPGLNDIYSQAVAYGTAAQASAAVSVDLARTQAAIAAQGGSDVHALTVTGGDTTAGVSFTQSQSGVSGQFLIIYYSAGRYLGELIVSTFPDAYPESTALALGQHFVTLTATRMRLTG
jgi:hypothetical protein